MPRPQTQESPAPAALPEGPVERHPGAVLKGATQDYFARLHDPGIELAIWERSLPKPLGHWLDDLPAHQLPSGRVLVNSADLGPAVTTLLDDASMPAGATRDAFLNDVTMLARLFMATMATNLVDVRLETISGDARRKFHRDFVRARLLTTYRGPGTDWVEPADSHNALTEQQSFQGEIQRFPRHAVGLFKGSNSGDGDGIVHRSPPIAGKGISRLLLCLNLPSRVSPEMWQPLSD